MLDNKFITIADDNSVTYKLATSADPYVNLPVAISLDRKWILLSNQTVLEMIPAEEEGWGCKSEHCSQCYFQSTGNNALFAMPLGARWNLQQYCREALLLPPCQGEMFNTRHGQSPLVAFKKAPRAQAKLIIDEVFSRPSLR